MEKKNTTTDKPKRPKYGGRKAGTPNKTTGITRSLINQIAEGMLDQVMKDLAELEPKDRVHVFIKLCEFNVSKPQSIDLSVAPETMKTIEDRLSQLSVENDI